MPPAPEIPPAHRAVDPDKWITAHAIGVVGAVAFALLLGWKTEKPVVSDQVVVMEPVRATLPAFDTPPAKVDLTASILDQAKQAADELERTTAALADIPIALARNASMPLIEPSSQLTPETRALVAAQQTAAVQREVQVMAGGEGRGAAGAGWVSTADRMVEDVRLDTSRTSYELVKAAVRSGQRPRLSDVRVEELINAFPYAYFPREGSSEPLVASIETAPSPWGAGRRLVRIGLAAAPDSPASPAVREARASLRFDARRVASFRRVQTGSTAPGGAGPYAAIDFARGGVVTALYEVTLVNGSTDGAALGELHLNYADAGGGGVRERISPIPAGSGTLAASSEDFRLAVAAAALGLRLQDTSGAIPLEEVASWIGPVPEDDLAGRIEFLGLLRRARLLPGP